MSIIEKMKEIMNKPLDQDQECEKMEDADKNVSRETSDTKKTDSQPNITELKEEITALNQQLQESNIVNMHLESKAKLAEQFENLKTIKVFLECVLLTQNVSKECGQKIELLPHLTPMGLKIEPKK